MQTCAEGTENLLVTLELENKKLWKDISSRTHTLFRSCFTWESTKYILVSNNHPKRQLINRIVFVPKPTSINHIVTRIIRAMPLSHHPGSSGWDIVFVGCEKYW